MRNVDLFNEYGRSFATLSAAGVVQHRLPATGRWHE